MFIALNDAVTYSIIYIKRKGEIMTCALFKNLTNEEIDSVMECSEAKIRKYEKNEIIFNVDDRADKVYILIEGSVAICRDSALGERTIINLFEEQGEMFGEVYIFLDKDSYDYYALCAKKSEILEIPKIFFYVTCSKCCGHHSKLIFNMLNILASKAYYLTQKNNLLSSSSLRQKIARYLIINESKKVSVNMSREEMAHFLNVARPSLSRELINMQTEGLISLNGKTVSILNKNKLEKFL